MKIHQFDEDKVKDFTEMRRNTWEFSTAKYFIVRKIKFVTNSQYCTVLCTTICLYLNDEDIRIAEEILVDAAQSFLTPVLNNNRGYEHFKSYLHCKLYSITVTTNDISCALIEGQCKCSGIKISGNKNKMYSLYVFISAKRYLDTLYIL